jgi:hypothetical protein
LAEIHPDAVVDDGGAAASDINFDPQLGGKFFGRNAPKLQHAVSLPPTACLRSAAAVVYGV